MAVKIGDLWNWCGTTGRAAYFGWGVGLMALKYNLDRLLSATLSMPRWTWSDYWQPLHKPLTQLTSGDHVFLFLLIALAGPFIGAGVVLTVRRLRDAGWPLWMVIFFFLPVLNLVFFTLLLLTPSRAPVGESPPLPHTRWSRLARRLALSNPVASACLAIALTVLLTTLLVALSTLFFKNYGWGVFVALPFCLGFFAALLHSAAEPRSWGACAGVAMLAMLFCGLALVAVAIEGLICVLMAAPLAAPVVLLGATAGYFMQLARWGRALETTRLYAASWVALPLAFSGEALQSPQPPLIAATTSVIIAAPPQTVWRHVVTFSELPPPREIIFRSGIAYPIRASIKGHGVGAVRHCEFSTGPFVEPITIWDESRRLAFDVIEQPHPMHELSPYRALDPPHLNGFFHSRRGQFLLIALPDGRTLLEGTTWYDQRLWPASYWQVWSDWLVHAIHARVLGHIKTEAEAERTT